ncbi:MAG: glycosyltransferase family 10 [Roseovarius sp.]|nr:glycosyltransferase family 10 [Roseovarius sp.]
MQQYGEYEMRNNNAVAIMPYNTKLGFPLKKNPLDILDWPLGRPNRLAASTLTIKDMDCNDHLIIDPNKNGLYINPFPFGLNARFIIPPRVSIMFQEPYAIHKRHMDNLIKTHGRFEYILCMHEQLLSSVPNALLVPLGTTWISEPQTITPPHNKHKKCSIIASNKRYLQGHILRHEIIEWLTNTDIEVDVIGTGYKPFQKKSEGLSPYYYSVVIENVREKNYFSEKLVDAILCKTIPIYWGCPNIGDFFDTSGIIICESKEEILTAMREMSKQNYQELLPNLLNLHEQAHYWSNLHRRAAIAVLNARNL